MKKQFLTAFRSLYGVSRRKAWKAWKTLDDGMKTEIISAI